MTLCALARYRAIAVPIVPCASSRLTAWLTATLCLSMYILPLPRLTLQVLSSLTMLCGAYGSGAATLFRIRSMSLLRPHGRTLLVLPEGLTRLTTVPLLMLCGSGSRMTQLA